MGDPKSTKTAEEETEEEEEINYEIARESD